MYLFVTLVGQWHAVVGNDLVDFASYVAFGLGMADEDDEAWFAHLG